MISIVIPLYNKEKQIGNTLNSVFNQTFQNFEIVIINDGSTDSSVDVVEQINDNRIRLINQENQGVSVARNCGITEAIFNYVAFLDADDEWKPQYLETQVKLIKNYSKCQVFACAYDFKKGEKSLPLILNKMPFEKDGILSNYFDVASCSHPPICSINIVVEKQAIVSIGGFPISMTNGEDLLTWARLACKYKIAYSLKSLATYNLKPTSGYDEIPKNIPYPDLVGEKLKILYEEYRFKSLRKYIGSWYKIRANLFLRANEQKKFIEAYFLSLYYYPFNYRIWPYIIFIIIPLKYRNLIFKKITSILNAK